MDSRRPPQRVGGCHLKNQAANFVGERWPSPLTALWPGESAPEPSKSFSLPADDGVGLNEDQRIPPVLPDLGQAYPKQPIHPGQHRPFSFSPIGGQLTPQSQILHRYGLLATTQQS